jgi:hypothetical protein
VNGDGYADVIVGARGYDAGQEDEGAAFVFLGSPTGIANGNPNTAATRIFSDKEFARLGSVAAAGDVNGDCYADVIVGVRLYDVGQFSLSGEGAAFVFLGGPTGIADGSPATASTRLESDQVSSRFGTSVAGAGDVDGDGYADVVVGASNYDADQESEGAAFVFLGGNAGLPVLARQRRGDGSGIPVQPWGSSASEDSFTVELRAKHPEGTGRVLLEIEACPSSPFGDSGCTRTISPAVAVGGAVAEAVLTHTVTGLATDTLYRWRARTLYAPRWGVLPPNPAPGHSHRRAGPSRPGWRRNPESHRRPVPPRRFLGSEYDLFKQLHGPASAGRHQLWHPPRSRRPHRSGTRRGERFWLPD